MKRRKTRPPSLILPPFQVMCIHMCMYMLIHTYVRTYIHTYIHTYIYIYVHTHIHIHIYVYVYTCVCVCLRKMCAYMYMQTYVCPYFMPCCIYKPSNSISLILRFQPTQIHEQSLKPDECDSLKAETAAKLNCQSPYQESKYTNTGYLPKDISTIPDIGTYIPCIWVITLKPLDLHPNLPQPKEPVDTDRTLVRRHDIAP